MIFLPIVIVLGSFIQVITALLSIIPFVLPAFIEDGVAYAMSNIALLDGIVPMFAHPEFDGLVASWGIVDVLASSVVLFSAVVTYKLIPFMHWIRGK